MECYHKHSRSTTGDRIFAFSAFFVVGVMKTCENFAEMKRPEIDLKMFIRFILSKAAIDYGLECEQVVKLLLLAQKKLFIKV